MESFDLYNDIATRTGGDIYVGVVGPVRTGKSTFIKKFMESLVIPKIENQHKKQRAIDEMPQSADGKTIMTTQPKFVPAEAVRISLTEGLEVNVRMIDCVGYLVDGALGHIENDKPRLVHTPWDDKEIPFEKAAEIGTTKVIKEHSTIGIMVTTDGTVTGIERSKYIDAEERVVSELKAIGKPFMIVLNSKNPKAEETLKLREALELKYGVPVSAQNVLEITEEQIAEIMESILMEFPIKLIEANIPKWMQALNEDNDIIKTALNAIKDISGKVIKMKDFKNFETLFTDDKYFEPTKAISVEFGQGKIEVEFDAKPELFYKVLSDECETDVKDDFNLLAFVKKLKHAKTEYDKIKSALDSVNEKGYGIVNPTMDEMVLEEPEITKQGSKYGVKLKATAPSLHIMKVDVETEINPIIGSEEQSKDMVDFLLSEFENNKSGIWNTNMFGKSLDVLVNEGINGKLLSLPEEAQVKLRKTLTRIVNEGKGGVICILI